MKILRLYIKLIDGLNEYIGIFVSWLTTLMVLVVFYDTVMRYAFKKGNVAIQEFEWHLFAVVFLIGAAYALKHGAHVRVDIIFTRLNARTKAWIDFLGSIFFLIPFAIVVIYSSQNFIANSWAVKEMSPDPGGLPARYALKAMIPLGFALLILQATSEMFKNFLVAVGIDKGGPE
jgi:TRAP-type mannitol/chloroaromatic compound transport system permease small subunit